MAHVLQGVPDLDLEATVLSIDGISAYDLISRRAMLTALANVEGEQVLRFIRLFYGAPSVIGGRTILGQCTRLSRERANRAMHCAEQFAS